MKCFVLAFWTTDHSEIQADVHKGVLLRDYQSATVTVPDGKGKLKSSLKDLFSPISVISALSLCFVLFFFLCCVDVIT